MFVLNYMPTNSLFPDELKMADVETGESDQYG